MPTYLQKIVDAIDTIRDRKGASRHAIKKYITDEYGSYNRSAVLRALRAGVMNERLEQIGQRFKLGMYHPPTRREREKAATKKEEKKKKKRQSVAEKKRRSAVKKKRKLAAEKKRKTISQRRLESDMRQMVVLVKELLEKVNTKICIGD